MLNLNFDKCTLVIGDVNIRENWAKNIYELSTLSLLLSRQSKIMPKYKFFKDLSYP